MVVLPFAMSPTYRATQWFNAFPSKTSSPASAGGRMSSPPSAQASLSSLPSRLAKASHWAGFFLYSIWEIVPWWAASRLLGNSTARSSRSSPSSTQSAR